MGNGPLGGEVEASWKVLGLSEHKVELPKRKVGLLGLKWAIPDFLCAF